MSSHLQNVPAGNGGNSVNLTGEPFPLLTLKFAINATKLYFEPVVWLWNRLRRKSDDSSSPVQSTSSDQTLTIELSKQLDEMKNFHQKLLAEIAQEHKRSEVLVERVSNLEEKSSKSQVSEFPVAHFWSSSPLISPLDSGAGIAPPTDQRVSVALSAVKSIQEQLQALQAQLMSDPIIVGGIGHGHLIIKESQAEIGGWRPILHPKEQYPYHRAFELPEQE